MNVFLNEEEFDRISRNETLTEHDMALRERIARLRGAMHTAIARSHSVECHCGCPFLFDDLQEALHKDTIVRQEIVSFPESLEEEDWEEEESECEALGLALWDGEIEELS